MDELSNDREIRLAIERSVQTDAKFMPTELFAQLGNFALAIAPEDPSKSKKRKEVAELEARLNPNNPDSYQKQLDHIYASSYESIKKNLIILTRDLGLD